MTTTKDSQTRTKRRLPWIIEIYRTDVGKKYAMAIVRALMAGNWRIIESMMNHRDL